MGRTVYRVIQEALTNVHKHARGAASTVEVTGDAMTGVRLTVTNRRPVAAGDLLPGSGCRTDRAAREGGVARRDADQWTDR